MKLALVVGSLLLLLALAETGLRLLGVESFHEAPPMLRLADGDIKYDLRPGSKGHAYGQLIEINGHGHRGRQGARGRFIGRRVVVLGDSITFGNFLPLEATYAERLHTLLNRDGSRPSEVLNLGVSGYDVLQEAAMMATSGVLYEPDHVVMGFCSNDVGIVSHDLEVLSRGTGTLWLRHSRLAALVSRRLERVQGDEWTERQNDPDVFRANYASRISPIGDDETELRALMEAVSSQYPWSWYRSEARIGRLRYAFEWIARLSESHGFDVTVVLFPRLESFNGDYANRTAHQIVAHEARRVGFGLLDMTDPFLEAGIESLRVDERDHVHPNEHGHRLVAEHLAAHLSEQSPRP